MWPKCLRRKKIVSKNYDLTVGQVIKILQTMNPEEKMIGTFTADSDLLEKAPLLKEELCQK